MLQNSPAHSAYTIGEHSYGVHDAPHVFTRKEGVTLTIGKFCSFAEGSTILLAAEHRPDWVTMYPFPFLFPDAPSADEYVGTKGNVVIGNDVWVGMNAMILSGVTIGNGAVIGAGAIVAKDVEAYSVVAGNPAHHIRHRFEPELCRALETIAWWDWPMERIREAWPLLLSGNVEEFVRRYQSA